MINNKVIDLDEYKAKKEQDRLEKRYVSSKKNKTDFEQEDRKKTLSLFMKVLATMRKESY